MFSSRITRRGGFNQEKSQKRCLGLKVLPLGPGVPKTSFGKIQKTHLSETTAKNSVLEVTLLSKVNFFDSQ